MCLWNGSYGDITTHLIGDLELYLQPELLIEALSCFWKDKAGILFNIFLVANIHNVIHTGNIMIYNVLSVNDR